MSTRGTASSRFRDLRLIVGLVVLALVSTVVIGISQALAGSDADAPTVSCPEVAAQLPEVPAAAAENVASELAALENQIAAANDRLATSQGQGGPNFIDNAILGPLADKRFATLERIEISIGRVAERPTGLTALAECSLSGDGIGGGDNGNDGGDNGGDDNGDGDNAGGDNGGGDNGDNGDGDGGDDAPPPAAGAPTVSCPDVAGQLPEVPAAAAEDVASELAALENQIAAANDRLATSQGQGGPNFIDNAILGPLADKRFATLERIEISIGRHAERPTGLTALAECSLN